MKRLNYNSSIKQLFSIVLMSILFSACVEDEIFKDQVEEGIPVEVSLSITAPDMMKVSTRLSDAQESQVNDLYLLIFDSKGKRKLGSEFCTNLDKKTDENGKVWGKLKLNTTSGLSFIYGIANVQENAMNASELKKALDRVKTIDNLKEVTATLGDGTTVGRIQMLVMSGTFQAKNATEEQKLQGECTIPTTSSELQGVLKLKRLESRITFNIKFGEKIETAKVKSWRVYNVPKTSYLVQNAKDAKTQYLNSEEDKNFTSNSFTFYMLENRKEAKQGLKGDEIRSYQQREKEKKESGKNTAIYEYVEPNATFVEIKIADMEIKNEKEGSTRTANVTYVIHLGYAEGVDNVAKAKDFKSKRNVKYTYNVTINDVESIVTEVTKEEEKEPGVEGDVVDAKETVFNLDAHFSCFILNFTYKETEKMTFEVKTPFGSSSQKEDGSKVMSDYKWIHFKRCTEGVLATHKNEDTNKLLNLFELQADIAKQGKNNPNAPFYYTIFVDEYYYEEAPKNTSWTLPYWTYFVNKPNRYVMLVLSPKSSQDGESTYSDAKYLITQKSIQTYYKSVDENTIALGMEHINETGAPNWHHFEFPIKNQHWDDGNGYFNMYTYLDYNYNGKFDQSEKWSKNKRYEWTNYAISTVPDNESYTFKLKRDVSEYAACLSRNRDENGDGKIDSNEIKWFLPTSDQLIGMYLGARSLTTPLFDPSTPNSDDISGGKYHYATSNDKKIWSEEGASFGNYGEKAPQQIRCVRNLGIATREMNVSNATKRDKNVASQCYSYNSDVKIFTMDKMDESNLRTTYVDKGELALDDNFSGTNMPYKKFQMSINFIDNSWNKWAYFINSGVDITDTSEDQSSLCSQYSERTDKTDIGKWRAPNQRELMTMHMQDHNNVQSGNYGSYTRTYWQYNRNRHFGVSGNNLFLDSNEAKSATIRCVRDVKQQ